MHLFPQELRRFARKRAGAGISAPRFAERSVWNIDSGSASLRLDVEGPNDVAPLVDNFGDELAEISGAHRHRHATEIGEPRLDLGIGKSSIDLLVELVDDFGGRVPGR